MIFSYFSNIASSGEICRKVDFKRLISMPQVAQLIEAFRNGDPNAKRKLPAFAFHASFPKGKRHSNEAEPSGLFMEDLDHLTPEELQRLIDIAIPPLDQRDTSPILLVYITPSGKGLRIVAKATRTGIFSQCRSISDYQHALAAHLKAEHLLDEVTTDLARLSFVPQEKDVLYLSDRLFTEEPEVTEFATSSGVMRCISSPKPPMPTIFPEGTQQSYDGVPLNLIFKEYLEQTGGLPQEGVRNSRFYSAARDLRYICDFNPKVLAAHFPEVGLPDAEIFQLCVSACQSSRCTDIPEAVTKAVAAARYLMDEEDSDEEKEEHTQEAFTALPHIAQELIRCTPDDFREATLLALLPIIGTLATRMRARYMDGEIHSPSFFTVVSSEQASGKSFARRLVNLLLASIAEEDARAREVERKFKESLKRLKNAKEQPEEPKVKIRLVPASISVAKLLQRMDYAGGDHLFSFAEEMDTIIKSNRSGAWSEKSDMYREGFDNATYGQDYMSESSYSANLAIYYNLLILGTPRQTENFFKDTENGMVSRCCFAMIPDQFGAQMPIFEPLPDGERLKIEHLVRKLRNASGEVNLDFLFSPLDQWSDRQRILALQENNRARDIFRRRSAVIGFRSVLAFSPLYDLNDEASRERLTQFAVRIADIVLRNQLTFAGEKLNQIILKNQRLQLKGIRGHTIFEELPEEFEIADVMTVLRARGMNTPSKLLIYAWNKNDLIVKLGNKKYRKK